MRQHCWGELLMELLPLAEVVAVVEAMSWAGWLLDLPTVEEPEASELLLLL